MSGIRVGEDVNHRGHTVSVHLCFGCGCEFTIIPPVRSSWGGCLREGCSTYDHARDVDRLFDEAPHLIGREPYPEEWAQ